MDISCAIGRILDEADQVVDDLFLELVVRCQHIAASLSDELNHTLIGLRWASHLLGENLLKHQEGDGEELIGGISEWLKRAHESKERLKLTLGNLPMLIEEVKGKDTRELFATCTDGEHAFVLEVEATSCVLIHLQVIDGRLKEAIKTDVNRQDFLDYELGWVCNSRLRASDLKTDTHAVLGLHQLDHRALTEWAHANLLIHQCILSCRDLVEVDLLYSTIKLGIQLLEEVIVLNSAFI